MNYREQHAKWNRYNPQYQVTKAKSNLKLSYIIAGLLGGGYLFILIKGLLMINSFR